MSRKYGTTPVRKIYRSRGLPRRLQLLPLDSGDVFSERQRDAQRSGFDNYRDIVASKGIHWDSLPDNHSNRLEIVGLDDAPLSGNSMTPNNVLFDLAVTNHLGCKAELITNQFTERLLNPDRAFSDCDAAQSLIIDGIPNFLTQRGPYHACIDEVRSSRTLVCFREWITQSRGQFEEKELREIKADVEAELKSSQSKVFLKYLDPKSQYFTLGKTTLGMILDALIPNSANLLDLFGQLKEAREKNNLRWQGFVLEARELLSAPGPSSRRLG